MNIRDISNFLYLPQLPLPVICNSLYRDPLYPWLNLLLNTLFSLWLQWRGLLSSALSQQVCFSTHFCKLILCFTTLQTLFISSNSLLVVSWGFPKYRILSWENRKKFTFFLLIGISFASFSCISFWGLNILVQYWIKVVGTDNFILFYILKEILSVLSHSVCFLWICHT